MAGGEKDNLPIYEARPPPWLPKAHHSADLGSIGFYPPRPDQEEEILSETNVKNGLTLALSVLAENFSAHETITPLIFQDAIEDLGDVMNQIFLRREEGVPPIPSWTFRLPSRVTLNDAKRNAWFDDLANPDVPLGKLGKSVPHGAKGHDLLDLMHTNNVAIPRAVWFLRVFGGNETAGLRNKPTYNPTQYSVEWANVVNGYLKKQLTDIALPMAPRPGLNIKQTFKGVLSEPDTRQKWISRFTYSLRLLRSFYSEGLVDNRTFLAWLVQQIGTSNLAQLGFIAHLADEYLDGMLVTRALTRPFVEACMNRLLEIRHTVAREQLVNSEKLLRNLLMRAFLALPSAFISPRNWTQHSPLLAEAIHEYIKNGPLAGHITSNPQALQQAFQVGFENVKDRNEAMLFQNLPPRALGPLSSVLCDIQLLNSLSGTTDVGSVVYFDSDFEESSTFIRKLDILLTWSVTPLQYGDHRPHAASSLLRCWRDQAEERAIRHDKASPDDFIQDQLFDWLDSCEVAAQAGSLQSVASLFGQLVQHGLFSYEQYIQRLIARGEPGLSFAEESSSRHRNFLRWIPLHNSSVALINHRKVTLYGVRAREIPEDVNEREIRKEIRAILPELFGGEPIPLPSFTDSLEGSCKLMFSAPLYEQLRVVRGWLLPNLKRSVVSQSNDSLGVSNLEKVYCISTILMAHCKAYVSMLEWTTFILEHATSTQLFTAVIETLKQHIEVWACMDATKNITISLHTKHQTLKARGNQNSNILDLLIEIDQGRYLDQRARELVFNDRAAYTNALKPNAVHAESVPAALPEILLLATNPNSDAPSMLANSLWYKYRSASDWGWKVWDNTIASLRQIPSMISDITGRRACALRYADFLTHIDHHLPAGIDNHILDWFLGSGKSEMEALNADAWDVATVILLQLAINGSLSATSLLQGLIYPAWQLASTVASAQDDSSLEVLLNAVNDLCTRLLLKKECGGDFPPSDLLEARGLRTRRRDVFRPPHFASMVDNIPALVLAELNTHLPLSVKERFHNLRKSLCQVNVFRQGIYRDLDAVHRAFGKFLDNQNTSEAHHEPLINALRMMLNDGTSSPEDGTKWHQLSSFLSPWKLAATSIEMRFSMKQLDTALAGEATRDRANAYLDKFTVTAFHQVMTAEEGDLLAEMLRGASAAIANKFVNAGLQRITEIITDLKYANFNESGHAASDMLRLLSNIIKPFRNEPSSMPQLQEHVQNDLLSGLCVRLTAIAERVSAEEEVDQMTQDTIFLVRLIHFILGFPGVWPEDVNARSGKLCDTLVRLATLFGSGITGDPLIFPVLLDTLYYVLDEIPVDSKALAYDPFRHYPDFELQALPSGMPTEYRKQMRTLLPYTELNRAVSNLAYASVDGVGTTTSLIPMQNRPWEWTENLGDHAAIEVKGEDKEANERSNVKNTASLSLELFGAQSTGEHILQQEYANDPQVFNAIRTFEDHLFGESVFQRDWRESRVSRDDPLLHSPTERTEQDDSVGPLPTFLGHTHGGSSKPSSTRGSHKPSPASSVRSRASQNAMNAPSVGSSLRQSPIQHPHSSLSGSTAGDPIDVDSLNVPSSSTHGSKRKAGDEVQHGSSAKRAKGKSSTTQSKKR